MVTLTAQASTDLGEFLDNEVYPRIDPGRIYVDPAHQWKNQNGTKWRGGCPWHNSQSGTSFTVDPEPPFLWHCAGCQDGGSAVTYLWRRSGGQGSPTGLDFVDVVRELAELAGVAFPEIERTPEQQAAYERRSRKRDMLAAVYLACQKHLWSTHGDAARNYLRCRGFDDDAINDLGLGLYPGHTKIVRKLEGSGYSRAEIRDAHLTYRGMDGYITYPWWDAAGYPLTLYGRWPGDPPEGEPKTKALPGEGSKSSPYLFNRTRKSAARHVVLVEGITDASIAHARGDSSVVACVAAQLSNGQIDTFVRYRVESVTIALDPDQAGENGIISCLTRLDDAGIIPYVAPKLPDGLDPDEFILQYGNDTWRHHIEEAIHCYNWMAQHLIDKHRPVTGEWNDRSVETLIEASHAFAINRASDVLGRHFWPKIENELGLPPDDVRGLDREDVPHPGWGVLEPLPSSLPAVPTLPADMLPEAFRLWLVDASNRASLPLEMFAAPAVVGLAAVVGRQLAIRPMKYDRYSVIPNLFGALVARPSMMKTHADAEGTRPLRWLAAEARQAYEDALPEAMAKIDRIDAEIAVIKKNMRKAAEGAADMPSLADLQSELQQKQQERRESEVHERRYMTSDGTIEKLTELLSENPRGLLVSRDELAGWFSSLERQGRETDRAFFLEAWSGTSPFTVDRIGRGTLHVKALCLNLFGTIQPGRLSEYVEGAVTGGTGDDGLMQRFQVIVYPDTIPYARVDHAENSEAFDRVLRIFRRLDRINPEDLDVKDYADDVPAFRFHPDAQVLYDKWRDNLEQRLRSGVLAKSPAFESHLGKYRSLMPTLALLFHLVYVYDTTGKPIRTIGVSLAATQMAAAWCDFLEAHARRIYASEVETERSAALLLAERIQTGHVTDGMKLRDIYRAGWSKLATPDAVRGAVTELEAVNWCRFETTEPDAQGGRPSDIIHLHPGLRG